MGQPAWVFGDGVGMVVVGVVLVVVFADAAVVECGGVVEAEDVAVGVDGDVVVVAGGGGGGVFAVGEGGDAEFEGLVAAVAVDDDDTFVADSAVLTIFGSKMRLKPFQNFRDQFHCHDRLRKDLRQWQYYQALGFVPFPCHNWAAFVGTLQDWE